MGKTMMRRLGGFAVMGLLAGVVWVACGPAGRSTGRVVSDAGTMLRDIGTAMGDGAVAQQSFDATCVAHTGSVTASGTTQTITYWVADIPAPGLSAASVNGVDVVLCGAQTWTASAVDPCPAGVTCSGEYPYATPALDCVTGNATFQDGRIVVHCGYRQTSTGGTAPYDNGSMHMRAHVSVH